MTESAKPAFISALESAFGPPSQAAFGSAIFYAPADVSTTLEQAALARYRYFVGDLWERYGEDAWMSTWQPVYTRPADAEPNILTELRSLNDRSAALSASMLLENGDEANAALSAAFDDATVTDLSIYTVGDGAAMSGILVAARRAATTDELFLILLLD